MRVPGKGWQVAGWQVTRDHIYKGGRMRYIVEGHGREIVAIGAPQRVCLIIEATDPDAAIQKLYETHDSFTRVADWTGDLIRVTPLAGQAEATP